MDLWTQVLDLTSRFVTPVWNELLQYIPLLLLGLLGLSVAGIAHVWSRNAALNRSRVARPLTAGTAPAGVHLPSPSIWPFVAPIGLFLVFASLVFGGDSVNVPVLGLGLLIAAAAAMGWLRDAGTEYARTEAGDHDLLLVAETGGLARAEKPIPPGIHLPGPSAWPFLAPIGLFFAFLGLVFGPILIIAGLLMAFIAAVGWYLDAGTEYHQVNAGHAAEPWTRDPERAFPKRLMPVYAAVAGVAVVLTLSPWLLSLLPGTATGDGRPTGPTPTTTPYLSAVTVTSFEQREIAVPADTPFTLTFENKQAGVPHNVAIFDSPAKVNPLFVGDIIEGPATIEYQVPALPAGTYPFVCSVHPPMTGTLFVVG
jgi:plastocyanin